MRHPPRVYPDQVVRPLFHDHGPDWRLAPECAACVATQAAEGLSDAEVLGGDLGNILEDCSLHRSRPCLDCMTEYTQMA